VRCQPGGHAQELCADAEGVHVEDDRRPRPGAVGANEVDVENAVFGCEIDPRLLHDEWPRPADRPDEAAILYRCSEICRGEEAALR
jgi:hypothetical protein